jgi:hypothetical protein
MGSKDSRPQAQASLEIKLLDFLYGEWGEYPFGVIDSQGASSQRLLPYREFQSTTAFLLILGGWLCFHQWDMDDDGSGT